MIIALLTLLACSDPAPKADSTTSFVKSVVVEETSFADNLSLSGTLEAVQHAVLVPEAQGRIQDVRVRIGDSVARDQLLLSLHNTAYAAGVRQAEAAVAMATAQAKQAEDHAVRMESLATQNAITQVELETAQANRTLTQAQLAQTTAALAGARQQLSGTRLRAPFDGVIVARNVHPGDMLGGATMRPPLQIADLSQLRLVTAVSELVATQVQPGTTLKVSVAALPGQTFEATIDRINGAVDPVTRTVSVEALLSNPSGLLKHGMSAEVALEGVGQTAVSIPRMALLDRNDGVARVMVLAGDTAVAREVQYGRSQRDSVPVINGLKSGERVLVAGHTRLKDGEAVQDVSQ